MRFLIFLFFKCTIFGLLLCYNGAFKHLSYLGSQSSARFHFSILSSPTNIKSDFAVQSIDGLSVFDDLSGSIDNMGAQLQKMKTFSTYPSLPDSVKVRILAFFNKKLSIVHVPRNESSFFNLLVVVRFLIKIDFQFAGHLGNKQVLGAEHEFLENVIQLYTLAINSTNLSNKYESDYSAMNQKNLLDLLLIRKALFKNELQPFNRYLHELNAKMLEYLLLSYKCLSRISDERASSEHLLTTVDYLYFYRKNGFDLAGLDSRFAESFWLMISNMLFLLNRDITCEVYAERQIHLLQYRCYCLGELFV